LFASGDLSKTVTLEALEAVAVEFVQKYVSVPKIQEILSKHPSIGDGGGVHTGYLLTAVK